MFPNSLKKMKLGGLDTLDRAGFIGGTGFAFISLF